MKCVICRQGHTLLGVTTVTLTRETLTLVVKDMPALVCDNCGEEYIDQKITADLLETAEKALQAGVQVDVRSYVAA